MKRLVSLTTALLVGLAPAAAVAYSNQYFTWTNGAGIEQGPVVLGTTQRFVLRTLKDGTPAYPAGYSVEGWYDAFTGPYPNASGTCGVTEPSFNVNSIVVDFVDLTFSQEGYYTVCLHLIHATEPEIWDNAAVYVRPNQAPHVQEVQLDPRLPVVGYETSAVASLWSNDDAIESCTVDYGDGGGPETGEVLTLFPTPDPTPEMQALGNVDIICQGPPHTYDASGSYTVTVAATDAGGLQGTAETYVTPSTEPYMYVAFIDFSYGAIRSGRLWNYTAAVNIRHFTGVDLSRATVTAEWRVLYGPTMLTQRVTTNREGIAKFALRAFPYGEYDLCVTNVEKSGLTFRYDEGWPPLCASDYSKPMESP
ncbi:MULTISPECIES: hypothetical protein [unclassified Anaeromyxobacter]|uniref:hypothetical protein n=1 Tax=unclassified Anaeromyxobacter TaxID=2620896 RepID=UPI001F5AC4B9|nr:MULTISPECIES: hypothetical protein [unclassified Anaeromyxobacter]